MISGDTLTRVWQETSLSQDAFAAAIGMKRSGVIRLLRPGKHGMFRDNFCRLAQFLGVTTDQLRALLGSEDDGAVEARGTQSVSGKNRSPETPTPLHIVRPLQIQPVQRNALGDDPVIALITGLDLLNPTISRYFPAVFSQLREIFRLAGYRTRLYPGDFPSSANMGDERAWCELSRDMRHDNIVGVAALFAALPPALAASGIPVVGDHMTFAHAVAANDDVVPRAVRYLAASGCRRLAMVAWGPDSDESFMSGTAEQFRKEVERCGLEFHPGWIRNDLHPSMTGVGWSEFREIWTSTMQAKPDGLVIADDQLIPDVARAITEMRISVPGHLRVAAHAIKDLPVADVKFPMARVEYDSVKHAQVAGEMLLKLIRGEPVAQQHVRLGHRLIAPASRTEVETTSEM
jgi:DNA-binding LacI/PurR family transcriptional regulator